MNLHIPDPTRPTSITSRWRFTCLLAIALLVVVTAGSAWAADIVVDSLADDGSGCTLREAIIAANTDTDFGDCFGVGAYGGDTITFNVAGTITLGSQLPNLTDGAGLTIDGGTLGLVAISGDDAYRVFQVNFGASLTLQNLTVERGHASGADGGGIYNRGTLTIANSTLSGNSADSGGGIYNYGGGVLAITGSTLSGNSADSGGGIYNYDGGVLAITGSTLSDNSADLQGGGIHNQGELTITNSTLSGNWAPYGGGLVNGETATVTNSTVSGNSADIGGGILNGGTLTLINSTLARNSASSHGGGLDTGGSGGSTTTTSNSIIADSLSGGDCYGAGDVVAIGHNLDTDGSCGGGPGFVTITSAQLNLGPLFWNDGPTQTHALLAGSMAINAGDQAQCTADGITTDQRGESRDGACDIGAYEFIAPPPPPQADLSISNLAAKTAKTAKLLNYTINVTNIGPNAAATVVVNDVLATGTGFVSVNAPGATCSTPAPLATGTVSCSYGSLPSGASIAPMTVVVKVTAKGNAQLNNTASVTGSTLDPNTANNSATATTKLGK